MVRALKGASNTTSVEGVAAEPKIRSVLARLLTGAVLSSQFLSVLTLLSLKRARLQVSVTARPAKGVRMRKAMLRARMREILMGLQFVQHSVSAFSFPMKRRRRRASSVSALASSVPAVSYTHLRAH